jgi:hypothetical protein
MPGSRWARGPAFRVWSIDEAMRETGLTFEELLALPDVQLLRREFEDGRVEEAIRMPATPVGEEKDAS